MKSEIENEMNSDDEIVALISTREELDKWKRKIGLRLRNDSTDTGSINPDNNYDDANSG